MPLPADYGKPIGRIALRWGSKELPTQSTVFSTYPGSDDKNPVGRPEIIHLAAKFPVLPPGMSELEVVEVPSVAKADQAKPGKAVAAWLASEPVVVEATDCFGHLCQASVLESANRIETRQAGPVLTEEIYQAILTPMARSTDPAKPTLKRFLRVRAYLTTYAGEDFASLALMIHNGSIDQPNGDVYYRQIRVGVPSSMDLGVWKKKFSPASGEALRHHVLLADRHWDRHRAHRFYDDGRPFTYGKHVVEVDGKKYFDVPLDRRGWPIDKVTDPACAVHAKHVAGNKLLHPAGAELLRYMNHDDQHLSRVFDAAPAAYLACDPVNRDRLVTLGGQVCAKLNVFPYRAKTKFGGYGSLHEAWKNVSARPGQGIHMGRANGWLNQALAYGFYLSKDEQIRQDCLDVACLDVAVREKAQMPAGNVTVHRPYSKVWEGEYWYVNCWQTVGIMGNGAKCLADIMDSPEHRDFADRLKKTYVRLGKWSATVGWDTEHNMPAGNVGLRRKGETEPLAKPYIRAKKSGGTNHYFGNPYLWYYELTGDRLFLDRLRETVRGDVVGASVQMTPNWSYCLWLTQGGKIPGRGGF